MFNKIILIKNTFADNTKPTYTVNNSGWYNAND